MKILITVNAFVFRCSTCRKQRMRNKRTSVSVYTSQSCACYHIGDREQDNETEQQSRHMGQGDTTSDHWQQKRWRKEEQKIQQSMYSRLIMKLSKFCGQLLASLPCCDLILWWFGPFDMISKDPLLTRSQTFVQAESGVWRRELQDLNSRICRGSLRCRLAAEVRRWRSSYFQYVFL